MTDTAATTSKPASHPLRRVLDIFYVRSSWKTNVAEAVEANIPTAAYLLRDNRFYILDDTQTREYLKLHYSLVASVPLFIVIDREAARRETKSGFGFRLCLGVMKNPETAVSLLKWGVQMALMSHTDHMTKAVRESGHRESFEGLIDLLGEGTSHLVEFGAA